MSSLGNVPSWISLADGINETLLPIELQMDEDKTEVFVGAFDTQGITVAIGSSFGRLFFFNCANRTLVRSVKPVASVGVRNLMYDAKKNALIVNFTDKTLRHYTLLDDGSIDDEPPTKFRDLVESPQWQAWAVSPSGEHIVSVPDSKGVQLLFIWNVETGELFRKMEGPREGGGIVDIAVRLFRLKTNEEWHPFRPIFITVSEWDLIFVWSTTHKENWSAFAPGFEEIDENREYQEMEDEFDMVPEHIHNLRKRGVEPIMEVNQDEHVDVTTVVIERPLDLPLPGNIPNLFAATMPVTPVI